MCMRPVNNDKLQNEIQLVLIMIVDGMACMASVIYNYLQHTLQEKRAIATKIFLRNFFS